MKLLIPSLSLLLFGSCAGTSTAMPPESNRMQEGFMPTPFSAELIASACTEGSFRKFSMETPQGEFVQTLTFGSGDSQGAPFTVHVVDLEGVVLADDVIPHTAWTEFQSHASYDEGSSTLTHESIETPAGAFDCWVYEAAGPMGIHVTNYFAIDLPGPPVLSLGVQASGEQVLRMELLEYGM